MILKSLKHRGFEGEEEILYFKLPRGFKLLVTHSNALFHSDAINGPSATRQS